MRAEYCGEVCLTPPRRIDIEGRAGAQEECSRCIYGGDLEIDNSEGDGELNLDDLER